MLINIPYMEHMGNIAETCWDKIDQHVESRSITMSLRHVSSYVQVLQRCILRQVHENKGQVSVMRHHGAWSWGVGMIDVPSLGETWEITKTNMLEMKYPHWLVVEPPLWKIWVNWDDCYRYMKKKNVPVTTSPRVGWCVIWTSTNPYLPTGPVLECSNT